jgi:hypothetical protein
MGCQIISLFQLTFALRNILQERSGVLGILFTCAVVRVFYKRGHVKMFAVFIAGKPETNERRAYIGTRLYEYLEVLSD